MARRTRSGAFLAFRGPLLTFIRVWCKELPDLALLCKIGLPNCNSTTLIFIKVQCTTKPRVFELELQAVVIKHWYIIARSIQPDSGHNFQGHTFGNPYGELLVDIIGGK